MNSDNTVKTRHGSAVITLPSDIEILITHLASRMESGMQVFYDRLEDLVRQAA